MIHPTRVQTINDLDVSASGKYVLYWMQASQRTRFNHALEYAIDQANALHKPLVVCFGLMDDYPEANERHYAFMLQGLKDVKQNLETRKILFLIRHGNPPEVALKLSQAAALLICDRGYLRHQKRWRDQVADHARCRAVQVESDVVVPVEETSNKSEFAARTIRPKIHRHWENYLVPLKERKLNSPSLSLDLKGDIDLTDISAALKKLKIDRSVPISSRFTGGEETASRMLRDFISHKLTGYSENRNEPSDEATSHLAPYLHFGQISPLQIALAAREAVHAPQADRDSLLEELIVRRELATNYVHYQPDYDRYDALPNWALKTLREHQPDPRPHLYTRDQLERSETSDPYWNAAQTEMTRTGFMHNYMRMYWGKRILEWKQNPEEAFADVLYLNNKYFLCGRDPNAYANVAWIFGLHDRPWGERKIFGLVRYMNAAGLKRKFDMDAYIRLVEKMKA